MKIVNKPWGKEIWLAYPPEFPYVMKKIYTEKGHRSSIHVHEKKQETNYIISGTARVCKSSPIADAHDKSIPKMTVTDYGPGESFSIMPKEVHRVQAIDRLVTIEVSTPQVDDVIRLQDDTGRGDGRIESEHQDM